jgi:hypothetical protein
MGSHKGSIHHPWPERFWAKVEIRDGCWEWQGFCNKRWGYGAFRMASGEGMLLAHRVMQFIVTGAWPNESRHLCCNPACVRPDHVVDSTHLENMQDVVQYERSGLRNGRYTHGRYAR